MRVDEKSYYDISPELEQIFCDRGYMAVEVSHQNMFDKYYDDMNDQWSANTSFITMIGWWESYPTYFKEMDGLLILIAYLRTEGYPVAIPFLGRYTEQKVKEALEILKNDFVAFGYPLVIMDVVPWMYSYYKSAGIEFDVEDNRDYMDYIFTPEDFRAGMDAQDDRYRYRYFMRKFEFETEEMSSAHRKEIQEFMESYWCTPKSCDECCCGCLAKVIDNIVSAFEQLRVNGLIVRVDGKMAGLSIVSCRNGIGVYQYKNAINKIKGINEYLLRESYERFLNSADIINYTEDMGEERLRRYKEHMAPGYSLLSKYTLTEKG